MAEQQKFGYKLERIFYLTNLFLIVPIVIMNLPSSFLSELENIQLLNIDSCTIVASHVLIITKIKICTMIKQIKIG